MKKEVKLEWYVLQHDCNSNQIKMYNVLAGDWYNHIKGARKKFVDRTTFKEWLRKQFMYYYWSKAEYEILVSGLFVKDEEKDVFKIDAWYQIEPNLDNICDYLISKMNFSFKSNNTTYKAENCMTD